MNKPEILAPAGSMDALKAAVIFGADAVYLAGDRFGARAYAGNFDRQELLEGIEYAHLYGVKVYLTVNTLFRNEEINDLYDYLLPLYEAGLDAVIVQDLGVLSYIHESFPGLPIHASTQMFITTKYSYDMLEKYGVTRIVPARELSFDEIKSLKEGRKCPELEVFVQGSLCYCYSGMCLMSSFMGGRSGNRGRCAQPCRHPYTYDGKSSYLLSPKDLCGLDNVKELDFAGVDSFKIEGRMKKAEYVALAVKAYRNAVDSLFDGAVDKDTLAKDKNEMAAVFNRGGFTDGYYKRHNGREMMALDAPGNMGICVGTIKNVLKGKVEISLKEDVNPSDILSFDKDNNPDNKINLTSNISGKKGEIIRLNAPETQKIKPGLPVYRMYDKRLMDEVERKLKEGRSIGVYGKVSMKLNEKASLSLSAEIKDKTYEVKIFGDICGLAEKKEVSKETVIEKIQMTGGSEFFFEELDADIDSSLFYPLSKIKELRREAFEMLKKEITGSFKRISKDTCFEEKSSEYKSCGAICYEDENTYDSKTKIRAMVSSRAQLDNLRKIERISSFYLDLSYFTIKEIIDIVETNDKVSFYIALPYVFRNESADDIKACTDLINSKKYDNLCGILVRNIDEFAYVKDHINNGKIITDYSLYTMNDKSLFFAENESKNAYHTFPVELNNKQMKELSENNNASFELIAYGYQPLMISAGCVDKTSGRCNHSEEFTEIKDRLSKNLPVKKVCRYCYNIIYNNVPTVIYDEVYDEDYYDSVRFVFTKESPDLACSIVKSFLERKDFEGERTKGHFSRGVE